MAGESATTTGQAVVIERMFDAPRELVWQAWTEPDQIAQWFGPTGYTIPSIEVDLRIGGRMLFAMRSPEGEDIWSLGVFREIDPPSRLAWDDSFADPDGNIVPASYYDMEGDVPLVMTVTVTLEDVDGRTKMTMLHAGLPVEHGEGANEGWSQSFDKLAEYLSAA